jgi:hypothetical protein
MRKVLLVAILLFIGTVWFVKSCDPVPLEWVTNGRNVSIKVKETGRIYEIKASYANVIKPIAYKDLSTRNYIPVMYSANARMDGDITLDDRSNFYVQAIPAN